MTAAMTHRDSIHRGQRELVFETQALGWTVRLSFQAEHCYGVLPRVGSAMICCPDLRWPLPPRRHLHKNVRPIILYFSRKTETC